MASSVSSDSLLAGKYRLDEAIGSGGMGTVYRALHLVLNRPVAVKLMNVVGSDPLLGERFLREARVAASVRHPNVVDIIDFGKTSTGQPFMVMELLEGQSLWNRMLASPPLTTDEVVHIIAQVLLGLDAVHRAGIIHRDLKPANIFVSPHDDGSLFARLLDFGISYSIDPESQLRRGQFGTDERMIVGTPEYISPEQAEGRPDVDVRGDVYAMGVILYELLTDGQLPYSDPNPGGVLFKVMSGGHVPLSRLRPDLPALAAVVDAALSHDRDRRPATARDLRKQLLVAHGVTADVSGTFARISDVGPRATPRGVFSGRDLREDRETQSAEMPAKTPAPRAPAAVEEPLSQPIARPTRAPIFVLLAVTALGLAGLGIWLAGQPAEVAPSPVPTVAVEEVARPEPPAPELAAPAPEPPAPPAASTEIAEPRRRRDDPVGATVEPATVEPATVGPAMVEHGSAEREGEAREERESAPSHGIVRELDF